MYGDVLIGVEKKLNRKMKIFIIIVSLVVSFLLIILLFFGIPYRVPTKSMEPTIKDGDIVFIGKNPFFYLK